MRIHDVSEVLLGGVWEPIVRWRTMFTIFTDTFLHTGSFSTFSSLDIPTCPLYTLPRVSALPL